MPLQGSTHCWIPAGAERGTVPSELSTPGLWEREENHGLHWDKGRFPEACCRINTERREDKGPSSPEGCATRFKNKTCKRENWLAWDLERGSTR